MNFKQFSTSDNQWHDVPYYQHKTATDTLTLPATLYPNDTSITVGIKGNTTQSGTPSPQSPVDVNGTGERTGNLFDGTVSGTDKRIAISTGGSYNSNGYSISEYIPIDGNTNYIINTTYSSYFAIYDSDKNYIYGEEIKSTKPIPATYTNARFVRFDFKTVDKDSIMFNKGLQSLPYEPYGVKIPISSANTTTPVYLGEVETTRRIKKLVLTGEEANWIKRDSPDNTYQISYPSNAVAYIGMCSHFTNGGSRLNDIVSSEAYFGAAGFAARYDTVTTLDVWKAYLQAQYAAGTPVCVWYVLATEETAVVNEPLRKIGDYADTVSGISIPTIAGANSFDVLTTLKPSEVELTYTGWHDAEVKEWDGSEWQ